MGRGDICTRLLRDPDPGGGEEVFVSLSHGPCLGVAATRMHEHHFLKWHEGTLGVSRSPGHRGARLEVH